MTKFVQDGGGFKVSENVKAWSGRDLRILDEKWFPEAINKQSEIINEIDATAKKQRLTDPERYEELQLSLKSEKAKLQSYKSIKERFQDTKSFQESESAFTKSRPFE